MNILGFVVDFRPYGREVIMWSQLGIFQKMP